MLPSIRPCSAPNVLYDACGDCPAQRWLRLETSESAFVKVLYVISVAFTITLQLRQSIRIIPRKSRTELYKWRPYESVHYTLM